MRFRHRIENARYVLRPKDFKIEAGFRVRVQGIAAQFRNHYFDSEMEQRTFRWSDAEREALEGYLLDHPDFNRPWNLGKGGLYLDEIEAAELHAREQAEAGSSHSEPKKTDITGGVCIWSVPTPEGVELCGEPLADSSEDYCPEHTREIEAVSA